MPSAMPGTVVEPPPNPIPPDLTGAQNLLENRDTVRKAQTGAVVTGPGGAPNVAPTAPSGDAAIDAFWKNVREAGKPIEGLGFRA